MILPRSLRFLPFIFFCPICLISQTGPKVISGQIISKRDSTPLPFTNISVQGQSIGTVSNDQGEFRLYLPANTIGSDIIRFSFLGYETEKLPVEAIPDKGFILTLKPTNTILNEILVKGINARQLVKKALEKIPQNYARAHTNTSFYRMSTRNDAGYMHLSEVVMEQFHPGYHTKGNGRRIKMVRMRALMDEKASHGVELGMKPKGIHSFDKIAAFAGTEVFSKKGLKKHDFLVTGEIDYEGHRAYTIVFDQKPGLNEALYSGRIYIDKESLAILFLDYGLSKRGLSHARYGDGPTRAMLALFGINIDLQRDRYQIFYKKFGDRWFLAKVVGDTWLNISSKREYYNFPTFAHLEYVVTDIDTLQTTPFSQNEVAGNGRIFENTYSEYSPEFWDNYNIILPDFDFREIANEIEKRNAEFDYKAKIAARIHKFGKEPEVRIDSILKVYHEAGRFSGVALIKKGDRILYDKGWGLANVVDSTLNSSQCRYRIGSVSKTFTAALVLGLIQDKKIGLQDSIGNYLPDYPHPQITIQQLLSHQSGLPSYTNNTNYLATVMDRSFSLDSLIQRFAADSLEFDPGTDFLYSNSGYLLLAKIAEQVSNTSFTKLMEERIFRAIGTEHTSICSPYHDLSNTFLAKGYLYGEPEPSYPICNTIGAGAITATAHDLVRWSEVLDSDLLLSSGVRKLMFQPHAAYKEQDGHYGLGWMIDEYQFRVSKKHKVVYHPGTDMGFFSMLVKQPDKGITIVLLSNHGAFPRFDISDLILSELN